MKKILQAIVILLFMVRFADAQIFYQYFDGADTSLYNSIIVELDTSSANIWQIGMPQKIIFDSAATVPNVIVTDTLLNYPVNNLSRFTIKIINQYWFSGIMALQWVQKLDMDINFDGGIVEFSIDKGVTWQNAFNNPYVYSFYGFDNANADTLATGEYAFSGTDSTWKNIWLCFDISWMNFYPDTALFRFTLKSDSVDNGKEGWMIDNMIAAITQIHTVKNVELEKYLNVYPNPNGDIIYIEAEKLPEFHIIEKMELINSKGDLVDQWKNCPTKFWFTTRKYPNGQYLLKVKTNLRSETIPIVIGHH